jgi:3-hydroxyisobutyrate dehydrogenase-like beta-hydroxyacid dehydrogenase
MQASLSLIGFGEAGSTFALAAGWEEEARAFDIADKSKAYREAGVHGCDTLEEAIANASAILSLVTADAALSVTQTVAHNISPDALYFDMNSVAPDTKRAAAKLIDAAGGCYVDVAVMAPVNPARLAVPLLLSGPYAQAGAARLSALGFTNVRVVQGDVGQASSIKMIRSIMIKGQEALTAEMMLAAQQAGVADEVLASLGDGWAIKADYNLERMRTHGHRRAAEMEEVAKTLSALGIAPVMTNGTIQRQREMAQ